MSGIYWWLGQFKLLLLRGAQEPCCELTRAAQPGIRSLLETRGRTRGC